MKKPYLGIILILIVIVTLQSLFSWYSAHKIDARELALFQVYIQAVDSETKENLNVGYLSPRPELSNFTGKNGQGVTPIYVEHTITGLVRAVWIDLENSDSTITLEAEGYDSYRIPPELIRKTESGTILGGRIDPETVMLRKTEAAAVNASAAASSSENHLHD